MSNIRRFLLLLVLVCSMGCMAQRRLVIIDMETLVPVGGANAVGSSFAVQADTLGFITVPDSCRSLVISHVNYESRVINLEEVRDTVFLISKLLNMKEVVVFGKSLHIDEYKDLQAHIRPSKTELQLAAAQPNGNLFGLLNYIIPKKWKKSTKEKRKERLKKVLEEY